MLEITSEEEQRVVGDEIVTSQLTNLGARANHTGLSQAQLGNFTWLWSGGVIYHQEYQGCWLDERRATMHGAECLYLEQPATADRGNTGCDVGRFWQSGNCAYSWTSACEL